MDTLFRSDRLFSAFTLAFERLGLLERWLDRTARAQRPAVAFSSLFPFQGDTRFVPPPATLWPPPAAAVRVASPVFATKVRWRSARFVPVSLVENLLLGQRVLAEQWTADAESGCLLRRDRPQASPFRMVTRTYAAVDRLGNAADPHSLAGIEFAPGSGLWAAAAFDSEDSAWEWQQPLRAALSLLADSGFGGRRSSGWGQIASFRVEEGSWPGMLLPKLSRAKLNGTEESNTEQVPAHWLLSLFRPGADDEIDWSGGNYSLTVRGGYVESANGRGALKKEARMVEEGSVVTAVRAPVGSAADVSPDGFAHPVYRAGFALSVSLPAVSFDREETPEPAAELAAALDEALKTATLTEGETRGPAEHEPKEEPKKEEQQTEVLPEIVAHTPVEQGEPQTPFDEAPAPPAADVPERLNVTQPPEETNAPDEANPATEQTDKAGASEPENLNEEPSDEV